MVEPIKLLHIHGQLWQHDGVYIVGNKHALTALFLALSNAMTTNQGKSEFEVFAADGEGYMVHVKLDNSDWQTGTWSKRVLPYTDETAKDNRAETIKPWKEKA